MLWGNSYTSDHVPHVWNIKRVIMKLEMEFNTREGQEFFDFYLIVAGFSVTSVAASRTANKKRYNEYKRITMNCNKHGETKEVERESVVPIRRTTVIAKSECQVVMVISEKRWPLENSLSSQVFTSVPSIVIGGISESRTSLAST